MLDLFFLGYVHAFLVGLPVFALLLVQSGAHAAGLSPERRIAALTIVTITLAVCAAASMALSRADIFNVPATLTDPPYVLLVLFGGAGAIWAAARRTDTGRRITDHLDDGAIIAFQIPRMMGALFLLAWAAGAVPWQFALPAGLGDIWAGVAAWQACRAHRAGAANARRLTIRANVIGMVDFAVAVLAGIMTSEGFAHLMAHDAPNIINLHPLAMFPGFFVPLFLGFHLISVSRLRQGAVPVAQPA
ncbi:hypothetical protein [Roseovarius aestuariivivens]|uniref:hypothetical protein n=1 Tax=Roseovarius aestuariivivens TaxID=1888910 RepID=UPI00108113D3|nr:hypothetical protein [Roseovarius aestuariivivens]